MIGRLTLRQVDLLARRHLELQDREDLRAEVVARSLAGGKPGDIFPRLKREKTPAEVFADMTRTRVIVSR